MCELLAKLSDEPELLESIFSNLADAVPLLESLLKVAEQECTYPGYKVMQVRRSFVCLSRL